MKNVVVATLCVGLAACASAPRKPMPAVVAAPLPPVATAPSPTPGCAGPSYAAAQEDPSKRGDYVAGGLYRPGERDRVPTAFDVSCISEPKVVSEPRSKLGNKPIYTVLDREYRVLDDTRGFVEEGLASYYGEKFHGRRTSNWEVYDMYAFSAAHKTLPLPSFARVTNLDNGKSVIVRINDRGPFHDGRVMDLSFAAAIRLGIYPSGTGHVRVEALQPGDTATGTTFAAAPAPARPASTPIDALVSALPAPSPRAATASNNYRYDMHRAATAGNADGFDAWMKERNVRVATGQPTTLTRPAAMHAPVEVAPLPSVPPASSAMSALPVPGPSPVTAPVMVASAVPAPAAVSALPAAADGPPVTLQVASFSTRDNADRALARLQQAGIAEARLLEALANGQPIWRLRVGPLSASAESTLLARLAGLGFGSARAVHD